MRDEGRVCVKSRLHLGESPVSNLCTSRNGLGKHRGSMDMIVLPFP
jgi:hypothetical protein